MRVRVTARGVNLPSLYRLPRLRTLEVERLEFLVSPHVVFESVTTLFADRERNVPRGLQMPKNAEIRPELDEEVGGTAMAAEMGMVSSLEPRSLAEAMKGPDWHHWKEAMEEELASLEAHGTWKLVDLPTGANLVGCGWTYVVKKDAAGNIVRYKARLVAQGFSQVPGIDFFDTYAPVAKMASSRLALAYGARWDYEIHQVDIKNAYLNAEFEGKVIHMKQPSRGTGTTVSSVFSARDSVWKGARSTKRSSTSGRRMPSLQ
jgi:hypothetical protein